jgi:hypothetical protein
MSKTTKPKTTKPKTTKPKTTKPATPVADGIRSVERTLRMTDLGNYAAVDAADAFAHNRAATDTRYACLMSDDFLFGCMLAVVNVVARIACGASFENYVYDNTVNDVCAELGDGCANLTTRDIDRLRVGAQRYFEMRATYAAHAQLDAAEPAVDAAVEALQASAEAAATALGLVVDRLVTASSLKYELDLRAALTSALLAAQNVVDAASAALDSRDPCSGMDVELVDADRLAELHGKLDTLRRAQHKANAAGTDTPATRVTRAKMIAKTEADIATRKNAIAAVRVSLDGAMLKARRASK